MAVFKNGLTPLVFGQDALAASQTDVQLPFAVGEGSQANDGVRMPFPYAVRAITWRSSVAATAGSLSIGVTKNGTENANTAITVTTGTGGTKKIRGDKARGETNDVLGVEITTSGTWDGTTADLQVVVWVEMFPAGL